MENNTSNTGYDDGTLKRVHNPIYEETTPGSADIPSKGAQQPISQSEGEGPTYETIKIFSSQHKSTSKENGKAHTKENVSTLAGQSNQIYCTSNKTDLLAQMFLYKQITTCSWYQLKQC